MKTSIIRNKEKEIVELMIRLYCRGNHGNNEDLCDDCQELLEHSFERIDKCPFMETKTFCSLCQTHCYSAEMRDRIRLVMKYSGPRMFLHHPLLATRHLFLTLLKKHNR